MSFHEVGRGPVFTARVQWPTVEVGWPVAGSTFEIYCGFTA